LFIDEEKKKGLKICSEEWKKLLVHCTG
jgi:hypothetical protein